jgi:hypothetical protein
MFDYCSPASPHQAEDKMKFIMSATTVLIAFTIMTATTAAAQNQGNGEQDQVAEVFFFVLVNEADPDRAFEAALDGAHEIRQENGFADEEIDMFRAFATDIWQVARDEGLNPGEAFEAVVRAVEDEEGLDLQGVQVEQDERPADNHWKGNCRGLCAGESEYWVLVNGELDGPYAVWLTDNNGNQVRPRCGCNDQRDPVAEAFFTALENGADPDQAFQAAMNVVRQIMVEEAGKSDEEFQVLMLLAGEVYENARDDGLNPGEAFEAMVRAMQEAEQGQGE